MSWYHCNRVGCLSVQRILLLILSLFSLCFSLAPLILVLNFLYSHPFLFSPNLCKKGSETCFVTSSHSYILDIFLQPSYLCSNSSQHRSHYTNICCLLSLRHSCCLTKPCLFFYLKKYAIPLQPAVVHEFFPCTAFTDCLMQLLSQFSQ